MVAGRVPGSPCGPSPEWLGCVVSSRWACVGGWPCPVVAPLSPLSPVLPVPLALPPRAAARSTAGPPWVHHGSNVGQMWVNRGSSVGPSWADRGSSVASVLGEVGERGQTGGWRGAWVNSGSNMGQSWVNHGSSVGQVWDNRRSVAGQLVGAGAGRPWINRGQGIGMTGPRLGQPGIDGGPTIGYAERSWAVYRGRGNRATLSSCSRCHHAHVYMLLQFL